jgi:hypothetical protein
MSESTKEEHPERYIRKASSGKWQFEDCKFVFVTTIKTHEFDEVLREWLKTKVETKKQSPEELGYAKEFKFAVCFPDEDVQPRRGRIRRMPDLLVQLGVVKVRPENEHTWLLKEFTRAIAQEGAVGSWRIFIKNLAKSGLCYRFGYKSDDNVIVNLSEEQPVKIAELKKLEAEGVVIFYHAKAEYNSVDGFSYADVALNSKR